MRTMIAVLVVLWGMGLVPNAMAAESNSNKLSSSSQKKYDAAYSICAAAVPIAHKDFSITNIAGPSTPILGYFMTRGQEFDVKSWKVRLIDGPKHGELTPHPDDVTSYIYRPHKDYLGPDQITYDVEAQGKKFKVIETLWVANVAPEYGGCPSNYKLPAAE